MGIFGGRSKRQRQLAETGTRVPAVLSDAKRAFLSGSNSSQRNPARDTKQLWVAHLPEGGTLEFEVKTRWSPQVGTYLEAAVNDERTEAVLVLDQDDYNIWDDKDRISADFGASEEAARQLLSAGLPPSEARASMEAWRAERDDRKPPPSLKDLKR
jgi:hypothetical protein